MQTERVTILSSATEKQWVSQKAASLGMSTAEFTRRAWRSFGDESRQDDGEYAALVAEANAAVPKIAASLERINNRLENMNRKNAEFFERMGIR